MNTSSETSVEITGQCNVTSVKQWQQQGVRSVGTSWSIMNTMSETGVNCDIIDEVERAGARSVGTSWSIMNTMSETGVEVTGQCNVTSVIEWQ